MSADHDPLTDAELDQLDALNRARTPGPFAIAHDRHGQANIYGGPDGEEWIALLPHQCLASLEAAREADARAIVAALNALPALLAEVRAARSAPSPSLAAALDAYGRAYCRAAHLDTQARRTALADAERAVLRCVEGAGVARDGWAEPDGDDGAGDTAPRVHIPRDVLTRGPVLRR